MNSDSLSIYALIIITLLIFTIYIIDKTFNKKNKNEFGYRNQRGKIVFQLIFYAVTIFYFLLLLLIFKLTK